MDKLDSDKAGALSSSSGAGMADQPVFDLDDTAAIADFIQSEVAL